MSVDHIRYDLLVRDALRNVVRRVIADAAKNGLPGEHHFYICFDTGTAGVRLSPRLREKYPQEMTIVLQHQFWDLAATDHGIEVGLSFGGVPEKLFVPFEAIKSFADPSVQFGLEFETAESPPAANEGGAFALPAQSVSPAENEPQRSRTSPRRRRNAEAATPKDSGAPDKDGEAKPTPEGGAEVVRLDRFRKK